MPLFKRLSFQWVGKWTSLFIRSPEKSFDIEGRTTISFRNERPVPAEEFIGNNKLLKLLNPAKYANEQFGLPTIADIVRELEKPGCDPRPEFITAAFKEGVNEISDLQPECCWKAW